MIAGDAEHPPPPAFSPDGRLFATHSSDEKVFISYSRREFYFAESLVRKLEARGIETWFDVHRLEPGGDWTEGIREGLRTSTMVVLVASRASLASNYVAAEWREALAAKKIVYVAVFESAQLPPELRDQSNIYDLRTDFDYSVNVLAKAIRERRGRTRFYLRPSMLGISLRLPSGVALLASTAAGIALFMLSIALFLLGS